jgi:hypothetical protein
VDYLKRLVGQPLIERPRFLGLCLAVFGGTKYIESVLDYLQRMAESSMFNRCALHRGHVDIILLKRLMGNSEFDYSGLRFDLGKVSLNRIRWLFLTIAETQSDSAVALTVTKYLRRDIAVAGPLLLDVFRKLNRVKRKFCSIGSLLPFLVASRSIPVAFFADFDMILDHRLLATSNASVFLFSVGDSHGKLQIGVNRNALYAQSDTNGATTIAKLAEIPQREQWIHVRIALGADSPGRPNISVQLNNKDQVNCTIKRFPRVELMAVILGGLSASPNVPHVEMGRISGFCLSRLDRFSRWAMPLRFRIAFTARLCLTASRQVRAGAHWRNMQERVARFCCV